MNNKSLSKTSTVDVLIPPAPFSPEAEKGVTMVEKF
jgi:hypothetical protein